MSERDRSTDSPGWHDRAVANAADAWLNDPQDYEAYPKDARGPVLLDGPAE